MNVNWITIIIFIIYYNYYHIYNNWSKVKNQLDVIFVWKTINLSIDMVCIVYTDLQWFSNESMTGKSVVTNAVSRIARMTSC